MEHNSCKHKHKHKCDHKKSHDHAPDRFSGRKNILFWITGLGSLFWLAFRSGTKPSRITYPCQQAAATTSVGFLGYLASITGFVYIYRRLSNKKVMVTFGLLASMIFIMIFVSTEMIPVKAATTPDLSGWTSGTAKSNVFAVENVPVPASCDLSSGALPASGSCSDAEYALHHDGVDALISSMEGYGDYFYKTSAHPNGIVGKDDVVVIKVNYQWAGNGDNGSGRRLSTNLDVLKGVIWRILAHPEGFTGEIVIADNTQDIGRTWTITSVNAENSANSYQSVVNVFHDDLSKPVSLFRWADLNPQLGGNINGGVPSNEFANGNNTSLYVLLNDPDNGAGENEFSYPKFTTAGGAKVSMRYGIWNGTSYDADKLTFINIPVLKQHSMVGATISWKNLIGFVTIEDHDSRFGGWHSMHNFFWGHENDQGEPQPAPTYGLMGRQLALINTPDLNIVDATYISQNNHDFAGDGHSFRRNILLASRDPFAVDWYSSEYVLYASGLPAQTTYSTSTDLVHQDVSAARDGVFRDATCITQDVSETYWSGSYPFIDLDCSASPSAPLDAEKNQMNVYVRDMDAPPPANYDLTVNRGGAGSGSVTGSGISCGSDCSESYVGGTSVTLTANPDAGSLFTGWSGAVTGSTNPINVVIDANKTVTANFSIITDTVYLAIISNGGGNSVNFTPPNSDCTTDCNKSYGHGTVVTMTATPAAGYTFTGWSGEIESTNNSITITMDAAKYVTATFASNTVDLTIDVTGDGSVTGSGISCGNDCSESYDRGTVVTLTATSPITSTFIGWGSDGSTSTSNPITLTMDADKTVTALFVLNELALTIVGEGSVHIDVANKECTTNCSEVYAVGTVVTLTPIPDSGYKFTGWSGACSGTTDCTMTMNQAGAVTATFEAEGSTSKIFLPIIIRN